MSARRREGSVHGGPSALTISSAFRPLHFSVQQQEIEEPEAEAEAKPAAKEDVKESSTEQEGSAPGSLLELTSVFLYFLVLLWTLAFAVMMSFGFDWFVSELGPDDGAKELSSQRAPCSMLALWLVTIAAYSVGYGPQSRAGWCLTGSALAAASYAARTLVALGAGGAAPSVPTLPVWSNADLDLDANVPDLLAALCLAGLLSALLRPADVPRDPAAAGGAGGDGAPVPPVALSGETQAETFQERGEEEEDEGAAGGPASPSPLPEDAHGPRSLVGHRVAAERGLDGVAFGTVADYDHDAREWLVRYDDASVEEEALNRVQLGSAFRLYSKQLSDDLKAMWRRGEL